MYQDLYNLINIVKYTANEFDKSSKYTSYLLKLKNSYNSFFRGIELRFKDSNKNNPLLQIGKNTEEKLKNLLRFIQYNKKPISVNSKNIYNFDEAIYFLNHLRRDINPDFFEDENIKLSYSQILIIAYLNYRMTKIEDDNNIEYWSSYNLSWRGFLPFYRNITQRFLEYLESKNISVISSIQKQDNLINITWNEFIKPFTEKLRDFFILESKKIDTVIITGWANNFEEIKEFEDILFELVLYNIICFQDSGYIQSITKKLYKIIIVESADKLGKTSFCEDIKNLEIEWDQRDQKVKYFHFPTPNAYKKFPLLNCTEFRQLGFTIDTLEYLRKIVQDLFDNNYIYLIDRAILSTTVYSFLDFKENRERHQIFLSIFHDLYQEHFTIEREILKFVSISQYVIVNEEPEKMKIKFDKDDPIEKNLDMKKWKKINNLYLEYIERDENFHYKAQDLPLGDLIKHYKIRYNNNENISIQEKRKERIDFFLDTIN